VTPDEAADILFPHHEGAAPRRGEVAVATVETP
jgi:hypothetical protein